MNVELVNTGSELMLGRVLNTHQQWLCRQLADAGHVVTRQIAVADTASAIEAAVREALSRADVVVTTGGLGPTSDDLTRDRIATLLGRRLFEDPGVRARLEEFFARRGRPRPARTEVQALVPEGARILTNEFGTAPGLILEVNPNPFRVDHPRSWLIMLPGPPRELRPMFVGEVLPFLKTGAPSPEPFVCRTLRSVGIGESVVEDRVAGPLEPLQKAGLEIGYCARPGEVDVRLSARGADAEARVEEATAIVVRVLGNRIFGRDDDEMEGVVVRLLTAQKKTLAVAESCTGGLIAHRITNVPGASAVFVEGWVTYSNAAKQRALGVRAETLAVHGAVSEAVAREMAQGGRQVAGADFALAVTGIAGPSGGTPEKPVGTVFIALDRPGKTGVWKRSNVWDRETFKHVTSQQALEMLRRALVGAETE